MKSMINTFMVRFIHTSKSDPRENQEIQDGEIWITKKGPLELDNGEWVSTKNKTGIDIWKLMKNAGVL